MRDGTAFALAVMVALAVGVAAPTTDHDPAPSTPTEQLRPTDPPATP